MKMQVSEILGFLISLATIRLISSASFKFDKATPKQCGQTTLLADKEKIDIYSSGNVPNGYCGLVINAIKDMPNCTYPTMCAEVKDANMGGCKAKVTLSGKYFTEKKEHSTELSCYSKVTKFCTQGPVMRVEVIEEVNYSKATDKTDYRFNITVSKMCSATKEPVYIELPEDDYKAPSLEEGRRRNYIIGLVVACCLASIFLITLIVMKCYYKSQPYSGLKSEK